MQLERTREHAWKDAFALAVKARVDQPRELDVGIDREGAEKDRWNRHRERGPADPALTPDRRDPDSQPCSLCSPGFRHLADGEPSGLDRHDPVTADIERQRFVEAIDQRRAVL